MTQSCAPLAWLLLSWHENGVGSPSAGLHWTERSIAPTQGAPLPVLFRAMLRELICWPWQAAEQAEGVDHWPNSQSTSTSQAWAEHSSYSTLEPAGGFPQKLSWVLFTRSLFRVPEPHDAVHPPQSCQSCHSPSTQHIACPLQPLTGITSSNGFGSQRAPLRDGIVAMLRLRRLYPIPHSVGAGTQSDHSFQLPHTQSTPSWHGGEVH
mmetsp:Transcript_26442/g.57835  ORF Transcript_26442/g.57835 Transcript_26442/m.57835 type:complete len:208 (-) Transcript_26442:992-1615(-)